MSLHVPEAVIANGYSEFHIEGDVGKEFFEWSYFVVNMFFSIEVLLNVIHKGLYIGDQAYLQRGDCRLDLFIIVTSWMGDYNPGIRGFPSGMEALRLLRVMKALRTFKFLREIQCVVDTVVAAGPMIWNVACLYVFWITMFGIFGVQTLMDVQRHVCVHNATLFPMQDAGQPGQIRMCTADHYGHGVADADFDGYTCPKPFRCIRRDHNAGRGYQHMDNFLVALNTLVEVSSMCNWNKLLLYGIDGEGWPVALYYVAVIMWFGFFVMQLFTAVMFTVFTDVRHEIQNNANADVSVHSTRA